MLWFVIVIGLFAPDGHIETEVRHDRRWLGRRPGLRVLMLGAAYAQSPY